MANTGETKHVWLKQRDHLPDVCCSCGMFTYNRIKLVHKGYKEKKKNESALGMLFLVFIHVFLGPIGWIIGAITEGAKGETSLVKQKTRIPVSRCQLCESTPPPEIVDTREDTAEFLIQAHPEFARRIAESRTAASVKEQDPFGR